MKTQGPLGGALGRRFAPFPARSFAPVCLLEAVALELITCAAPFRAEIEICSRAFLFSELGKQGFSEQDMRPSLARKPASASVFIGALRSVGSNQVVAGLIGAANWAGWQPTGRPWKCARGAMEPLKLLTPV